jgi:hypothetical protein
LEYAQLETMKTTAAKPHETAPEAAPKGRGENSP